MQRSQLEGAFPHLCECGQILDIFQPLQHLLIFLHIGDLRLLNGLNLQRGGGRSGGCEETACEFGWSVNGANLEAYK